MFFEFTITLENQKTNEQVTFNRTIPYSKGYLEAWQDVLQSAYTALEGLDNYWYIKSMGQQI